MISLPIELPSIHNNYAIQRQCCTAIGRKHGAETMRLRKNTQSDRSEGIVFALSFDSLTIKTSLNMFFLWYLLVGLVSGWLANLIVKGKGSGLVINLIIGVVGGLLGGWIFSLFGLFAVGTFGSIIMSVVGAVVLLWIAAVVYPRRGEK